MKKDEEKFKEIYEQNFKYIYSFVYARVPGNSEEVEDLVQNVFICAFNSIGKFKGKSSCKTWLCGIAKHKIFDFYRMKIGNNPLDYIDEAAKTEEVSLEDTIINNDTKLKVIETLNKLPPLYRYAIILKYMDGCSIKEIADITGKTQKSIDGILQRGKQKFKEEFKRLEEGKSYEK